MTKALPRWILKAEKILRTDIWSLVHNADLFLEKRLRVVELECGHKTITPNVHRAKCPRCQHMVDSGFDYDGFRNLRTVEDDMEWPQDPCRFANEPDAVRAFDD